MDDEHDKPEPEPKPEPKPGPMPEPKHEPKPVPMPGPMPGLNAESAAADSELLDLSELSGVSPGTSLPTTHTDASLKVPMRRVAIELHQPHREPRRLEVFVAEYHSRGGRPQDVLDLLEQDAAFLPGLDADTSQFQLFNKENVLWIAIEHSGRDLTDELELADRHSAVRVELLDGILLEGELLYTPPSAKGRVVDFLNMPGRFFRLHQVGRALLVNKSFVLGLTER
ncbi:MAG: hypothetical protein ABI333_23450 [bacterium]